ncbi:hypothetical protein [Aquimarina mytili]|uniref:Uncharacterized protein n=1 Tax=Aquimarina mytili TaxID=874423 RepID=A0A937D5I0_9FLAO|nr:hypothetical protein [Aquimarina mytili]MBL0683334.1 hypothetical protein [Aquimarina mytili]
MSEKWKNKIKTGGIWGGMTAIISNLFRLADHVSFEDIFFTYRFLLELLVFLVVGILFFSGGFNVKPKE